VRVRELLAVCFALFTALLLWPVLSIPNRPVLVAGLPALVLYLFAVWAAVVAVLAWAARRERGEDTS
jgi:membrane protein implicated in regulation of membrane protease activity